MNTKLLILLCWQTPNLEINYISPGLMQPVNQAVSTTEGLETINKLSTLYLSLKPDTNLSPATMVKS